MTKEEAIVFLRKVCAERIQILAKDGDIASAEAVAHRCEIAFTSLKETENDDSIPIGS